MATAFRRLALLITAACFAGTVGAAWAQSDAAGRFLSVTGQVSVLGRDGSPRAAERGSELREGETVVTGDAALAQMRMSDGSLLSLRGGSEFKLEQFAYAGKNDSNASFVVSVIKGGFRTITGFIAQLNRRGYRITTPSATIGVRGTHFEVVHVLPQIASQEVPAGTYNRVFEGITTVQNPAGVTLLVNREQTAFAGLQPGTAPVLVAPPAAIFGRPTPVPRAAVPAPAPTLTPLEPTTTLRSLEPATTTISPTTTIQQPTTTLTPLAPLMPLEPAQTISPTTTILQSPTTTTIMPTAPTTTILQSPTTTTITPTAPTTTILQSPTTIIKQPTTTITPLPPR